MRRLAGAWRDLVVYAWNHPFARQDRLGTYGRILRWQWRSRTTRGAVVTRWVNGARLALRHGQSGATGNLYYGLHEYADLAFFGHFLREGDVFADIGANAGSYTVLAGGVAGARVLSFEPVPATMAALRANVDLNDLGARVELHEVALGAQPGVARFTCDEDAMNRFADAQEAGAAITVSVDTLDARLADRGVVAMKVDVEGAEERVFAAAGRVLAEPQLVAIEVETARPAVRRTIEGAGFREAWYDPRRRELAGRPNGLRQNNHLFVRNHDFVAARLRSARALQFGRLSV